MKIIEVTKCKVCPYYAPFPSDSYDGECNHPKRYYIQDVVDGKIVSDDAIPSWCLL